MYTIGVILMTLGIALLSGVVAMVPCSPDESPSRMTAAEQLDYSHQRSDRELLLRAIPLCLFLAGSILVLCACVTGNY